MRGKNELVMTISQFLKKACSNYDGGDDCNCNGNGTDGERLYLSTQKPEEEDNRGGYDRDNDVAAFLVPCRQLSSAGLIPRRSLSTSMSTSSTSSTSASSLGPSHTLLSLVGNLDLESVNLWMGRSRLAFSARVRVTNSSATAKDRMAYWSNPGHVSA